MPNIRIKDLPTTASATVSGDFFGVDSNVSTRKLNAFSPTFGGNLVVSGTGTINGTSIPASKTLVVTTDKLSALASTSSSELAGVISDETGTGALVFANTPTLVTPNIGAATGTSFNLSGSGTLGTTLVVNGTTDSSSKDTGAIVTEGGLGVEKSATIGGNAMVAGTLGVGPSSTLGTVNITTPNLTYGTVYLNGATTGADFMRLKSSGADGVFGIESSVGSAILSGSLANATVLYSVGSNPLQFGTAGSVKGTLTSGGNLLIGTTTDSSNGRLQLATHTTSAGGIGFGTDISLYRVNPNSLKIGLSAANFTLDAGGSGTGGARIVGGGGLTLTSNTGESLYLQSGGLVGITINSSQQVHVNATTASTSSSTGALTVGGGVGVAGNLNVGGEFQISSAYPAFKLTDTNSNSDFTLLNDNGRLVVYDETNAAYRLTIGATGGVKIGTTPEDVGANNLTVQGTLAVSGGSVTLTGAAYSIFYADGSSGGNFTIRKAGVAYGTLYGNETNTVLDSAGSTNLILQTGGATRVTMNSTRVSIPLTTASTSTSSGALVVSGGVGVAGAIYAGGVLSASNSTASTPTLLLNGAQTAQGITLKSIIGVAAERSWSISTNVTSYGDFQLRVGNAQTSDPLTAGSAALTIESSKNATFAGTLEVNGYVGIKSSNPLRLYNPSNSGYSSVTMGADNVVSANYIWSFANGIRIPDTTASNTTSTGALVVSGGVGVAGAVYAGGKVVVNGGDASAAQFAVASASGTLVANLTAGSTTNQSFGLRMFAGTSASDYGLFLRNVTDTTTLFKVDGVGGTTVGGTLTVSGTGTSAFSGPIAASTSATNTYLFDAINTNAAGYSLIRFENTGASGRSFDVGVGGATSGQPGLFYIYDNLSFATRLSISSAGTISLPTTTASTSTSTGALVVSGGVGVAKEVYVGKTCKVGTGSDNEGYTNVFTNKAENTAGPFDITLPSDCVGVVFLNSYQSGVGRSFREIPFICFGGTVTLGTSRTTVLTADPVTSVAAAASSKITISLYAGNTNCYWGIYVNKS